MRRLRRRGGQAMVEFAIVLPVLVMSLMALFDMARIFYVQLSLDAAAEAGARVLSSSRPESRRRVLSLLRAKTPGVGLEARHVEFGFVTDPQGTEFAQVQLEVQVGFVSTLYLASDAHLTLRAISREKVPESGLR